MGRTARSDRWLGTALLVAAVMASATRAEPGSGTAPVTCPDPRVAVSATDPAWVAEVCAAVSQARPVLSGCGLTQTEPVSVNVVANIPGPDVSPHCLAQYDCAAGTIAILDPDSLARALDPGDVLARIPGEELFASLIAHELTHAFYTAAIGNVAQGRANHEYVAYAMQYASLPPALRAQLLTASPGTGPVAPEEMNEVILAMAPAVFAAKVWRHFSSDGNGCAFVGKLMRGEASLALPPP
jgi:hypothetical protein